MGFVRMKTVAAAVAACFVATPCAGQLVVPVEFETQASMMAPRGVVEGCGLRFIASRPYKASVGYQADAIDGSLMAFAVGMGSVKAGWTTMNVASGKVSQAPTKTTVQWIKVEGHEPLSLSSGKPVPTEDSGYSMYTTNVVLALSSLISMSEGKNLWMAFAGADCRSTIFSGPVKVEPTTLREFDLCIESLSAEMLKR